MRSILIALSKPNQLRHRQLAFVFNALELWSPEVGLTPPDGTSLYCVDLSSEYGPQYERLVEDPVQPRGIDATKLVAELEAHVKQAASSLPVPDQFPAELIIHLADSLGAMRQRAFNRAPTEAAMKVCVGLTAAHYFLSGGVEFQDQLDGLEDLESSEVNPFAQLEADDDCDDGANDVWDLHKIPLNPDFVDPLGVGLESKEVAEADSAETEEMESRYHFHDTTTLDTSPGGYRIRWNEPLPPHMQAGELTAIRDENDPRWCIAIARWIRMDVEGTSMGVELLSPHAVPVAIRRINKKGGPSSYTRAFLLPALAPIGQPATLVTPPVFYEARQKINILRSGVVITAQLDECNMTTESFSQFSFHELGGYAEQPVNSADETLSDDNKDGDQPLGISP